jgi:hypothetical protein
LRAALFFAGAFFAADFRAVDLRAVDVRAVDVRAVDFFAPLFLALVFFALVFFAGDFFAADFFAVVFLAADFFGGGTLPPSLRASDRPIAIACLRLVTFLPDRPLFSVPSFFSCIASPTLSDAFFPYVAIRLAPVDSMLCSTARDAGVDLTSAASCCQRQPARPRGRCNTLR